ncbi:glutathione transferase omega-1 [Colletotrichum tofieldiae]|uniref:Glutathione transferase omega-1 n=1 Tax=Colletotrichum tofieldiae TaxID=708197 RepID=A0A166X4J5_9PEZI|nr:glutathione transferase omega-1 [Colletotrichum tofieldiae]GKT57837.1 glutathione transferase omega-1 [Colletotrichum tofieldiae]GKT77396.1 glutathione transferase omega-1 [Colletotrichum tofieldiae]GKT86203.1 glutathione transferase omega-1 [Colletotrichum tofieldiae]
MDGYPVGSLDHNIPHIVLAGLSSGPARNLPLNAELRDQALLLRSELPSIESRDAEALRDYIVRQDGRNHPWNGRDSGKPYKLRVTVAGRSLVLPPRRARLPEDVEAPETPAVLHSPFSPLSPVSPLYPDGLMNTDWLQKHEDMVPSVYVSFYTLTADPTLATLHDNQLKTDINNTKAALSRSGYRTRFAVVLLNDGAVSSSMQEFMQERLDNIRRGVALDTKSFFYLSPHDLSEDLEHAADSMLAAVFLQAIEYYRDLGRHARKKRSRGVAPQPTVPPTNTSQTLTVQDWNVRYDYKTGIFAEYRQEMDAALRSYDQAYEGLLSQDVMDIIPSWSPRWNEARMLADVIAIRSIRCLLWGGQTTSAVRRWQIHRDRIADFVDRRGRGTNNYGWAAWESRWTVVMANLIERVDIRSLAPSARALFLQPEKAAASERLQPWEMLHHTGYWYRIAAEHLAARRTLARSIPEEDRRSPDTTPASAIASKAFQYDTYMCPDPHEEFPIQGMGVNHSQLIIDCLMAARSQFQARRQLRLSAELSLECAKEMVNLKAWDDIVALLRPLWEDMSFRTEGWLNITEDLSWVLRAAAAHAGQGELVLAIDWELLNRKFMRRPKWHYDICRSLEGLELDSKPTVTINDDVISSFISASFIFKTEDGKAGETCQAQLAIKSDAFPDATTVTLKGLKIDFEGSLKTITIGHETNSATLTEKGNVTLSNVPLTETARTDVQEGEEGSSGLSGSANLSVKPGHTNVYEMAIPLREPGEAHASSATLILETDAFTLNYTVAFRDLGAADFWFSPSLSRRRIVRQSAHVIQIQPRPPKLEIKLAQPLDQFYANEPMDLLLDVVNAEDAEAVAKLEVHVFGEQIPPFRVHIENEEEHTAEAGKEEAKLTGLSLGTLATSQTTRVKISLDPVQLTTSYDVTLRVFYHLATDPATLIMQIMPVQLTVVNPFEANYDLIPRLHPDPWPSLFDHEGVQDSSAGEAALQPRGLAQKWCLVCHFASFATEDLEIVGMDAEVIACHNHARCTTASRPEIPEGGLRIPPKQMQEAQFNMVAQKFSLDDKGPASLDVAFVLKWRRTKSSTAAVNTTRMLVPRYIVLGTEPRVLASYSLANPLTGLVHLDITIENPSSHFLTFGLSMEPSDEFAFSGSKQTTVHVLPVSRRSVTYRLLPLVRGDFIRPTLVVRDKYFQKVLRIIPTEGMKIDKEGLLVWIPPEQSEEEEEGGSNS